MASCCCCQDFIYELNLKSVQYFLTFNSKFRNQFHSELGSPNLNPSLLSHKWTYILTSETEHLSQWANRVSTGKMPEQTIFKGDTRGDTPVPFYRSANVPVPYILASSLLTEKPSSWSFFGKELWWLSLDTNCETWSDKTMTPKRTVVSLTIQNSKLD